MPNAMQKRRSHKKSRRGCINCKKWHTKCDELGPPCTNCSLRNAKCEYAWSTREKSLALAQQRRGGSSSVASSDDGRSMRKSATPEIPASLRVLELELMHQWATSTFQSFASIPEDYHYLQNVLPREALGCDYLLNGIFTASALHMSTRVQGKEAKMYYNKAMELYDKASISFRTELSSSSARRDRHHLLYMFSAMTAFINITFAQCAFRPGDERGILSSVAVAFDLLNGCLSIALADFAALLESPIPLQTFFSLGEASADLIDPDARAALDRLEAISERYFATTSATTTTESTVESATMEAAAATTTTTTPIPVVLLPEDPAAVSTSISTSTSTSASPSAGLPTTLCAPSSPYLSTTTPPYAPTPTPTLSTTHPPSSIPTSTPPLPSAPAAPHPYTPALTFLTRCYAEDARGVFGGFSAAFPSACGAGFAAAIQRPDPLALLILMHWAVLLERMGGEYWWARDLGQRVVEGATGALVVSMGTEGEGGGGRGEWEADWVESVAWVRGRVGLVVWG
ncbi:hypothetical protein F4810DRAFT_686272 [Camillea tinctor]|nr:hypothetical protein F4810DRAFT_686272 [Camillea tinctor]